jgi:hypothetical protein
MTYRRFQIVFSRTSDWVRRRHLRIISNQKQPIIKGDELRGKVVMIKNWSSLVLCLFGFLSSLHGEMDCQKAYPVPALSADATFETSYGLDLFKGFFRVPPVSAEAKLKATMAQHDVLAKYPNADIVALRQQELSYVCELLNGDKELTTREKSAILQNVVEGSTITKPMLQRAKARDAGLKSDTSAITTTIVGNGNAVGTGNTVINGNGNQIQVSQPPNLYAEQTTYRTNGIKDVKDDSAGQSSHDASLESKYYEPIIGAGMRGEPSEVLRLADMAIKEAPNWFTPYYERGRALIFLCHESEAIEQLNVFISSAKNAPQYRPMVQSAEFAIKNAKIMGQSSCK